MNTDTTATGPLVADTGWELSPMFFFGFLMFVIGVVIIGITVLKFLFSDVGEASGLFLLVVAMNGLVTTGIGTAVLAHESKEGEQKLDAARVSDVISDQYRITSIESAAEDDDDAPTAAQLCEPVSPKSPEYIGVADGQQIRFKAGSTNCTSNTPDIAIIVTDTPGATLNADDLRKSDTTEEP